MGLDLGGFPRGGRKPVPPSLQGGAEGRPLAVVRGESGACVFAAVRRLKGCVLGNGRQHLYSLSTPKPLIPRILRF